MTAEKNIQWLKEIAFSFGMTISKFAETCGYTRQTLYCAAHGTCKLSQAHLSLVVFKLITLSDRMLEQDIQSANASHKLRRKLIDDFAKRLIVEDK